MTKCESFFWLNLDLLAYNTQEAAASQHIVTELDLMAIKLNQFQFCEKCDMMKKWIHIMMIAAILLCSKVTINLSGIAAQSVVKL